MQPTVASRTSQLVNRNVPFQMVLQTLQNDTFWILNDWYMNIARASNISSFWFPWTICSCPETSIFTLYADVISKLNQKYQTNIRTIILLGNFLLATAARMAPWKEGKKPQLYTVHPTTSYSEASTHTKRHWIIQLICEFQKCVCLSHQK